MKRLRLGLMVCFCLLLISCSKGPSPIFQALTLPKTPNYYLVCPQNYCNVKPSAVSPVYPVPADDLFNAFTQIIATEPRIHFVNSIPEEGAFFLEQDSLFGFPDDIAVQFVALSDTTSTLAIYSKSRFSPYDFGVNKRRINYWLAQLNVQLGLNQNGTEGRNRTDTVSPPPDFESGASTSSATPA